VTREGTVGGFIGVLPLRMMFRDAPIRAAVAGSLMVDRPADNPLAGARLFRSFLSGPQDLSLSETANAVSHGMWVRLGGKVAPGYSMGWLRVLRPAGFATAFGAESFSPLRLARPIAAAVDAIVRRLPANPFRLDARQLAAAGDDVGDAEAAALLLQLADGYALRPQWDPPALRWMLGHAARKERYGELT